MKKIPEEKIFKGNIYRCLSTWSVAGSYFGVEYKEELVYTNKTFVLLKDESYAELEDFNKHGKKAIRYNNKPNKSGDYFVKDLIALIKTQDEKTTLL